MSAPSSAPPAKSCDARGAKDRRAAVAGFALGVSILASCHSKGSDSSQDTRTSTGTTSSSGAPSSTSSGAPSSTSSGGGGDAGPDAGAGGGACGDLANPTCTDDDLAGSLPAGVQVTTEKATLSATRLRGYGCVDGTSWALTAPGGAASVLRIDAADEAHAALTLAKYTSDLQLLGGVTAAPLGAIAGWSVAGQGFEIAFTSGASVVVVAAGNQEDATAIHGAIQACPGRAYTSSAPVPMYLDRWDKHAFNFNYTTFENDNNPNYDYLSDFQYAHDHGGTGFTFYDGFYPADSGESFMEESLEPWVIPASAAQGLPVVIMVNPLAYSVPSWVGNRYRGAGLPELMPGYRGNFYSAGTRAESSSLAPWGGGPLEEELLGDVEAWLSDYGTAPNVISIQEPHEEMQYGYGDGHVLFSTYGPAANASFQAWLAAPTGPGYASPAAVGTAWYGDPNHFATWADVVVPELSSFLGHDASAVDLTGPWRLLSGTSAAPNTTPPWAAPGFDDSSWVTLATLDDHMLLVPQGASGGTAWRTTVTTTSSAQWLYVWTLNTSTVATQSVGAWLDGTPLQGCVSATSCQVGSPMTFASPHWGAFQLPALTPGSHTIALSLPGTPGGGFLGYQVYLSNAPPRQYPNLATPAENQRWYDYSNWFGFTRLTSLGNGLATIRRVDANKPIDLSAPGGFADLTKTLAQSYGGAFHDTGGMASTWNDTLPALMRGSGQPFSAETGGPAQTVLDFKHFIGYWITEGLNGASYVSHIGDVIWNPDIKAEYEAHQLPLLLTMGKYHLAPTPVAQLWSGLNQRLEGWPFYGLDRNVNLDSGDGWMLNNFGFGTRSWSDTPTGPVRGGFDVDAVTEQDFAAGNAARYRVIIDSNTSLMSAETVADIQAWVSAGGSFVTYVQTGRHSPTQANSWPIATLTGYDVASIDPYGAPLHPLSEVTGQTLLTPGSFEGQAALGLHLTPQAGAGTQDVLQWSDGSTALGVRAVGKGRVITVGAIFSSGFNGYGGGTAAVFRLMGQILDGAGVARVPATASGFPPNQEILRHFVSNNGLFDVWALHNDDDSGGPDVTVALSITTPNLPSYAIDVADGSTHALTVAGGTAQLPGIVLAAHDTKLYLTPRLQIASAPEAWFELQRGWWQGTTAPPATPLPPPPHRYTIDLHTKYPLNVGGTGTGWTQSFTVPTSWTGGKKELWVASGTLTPFVLEGNMGRVFIDGTPITDTEIFGVVTAADVTSVLTPGSSHTFQVQTMGTAPVFGVTGEAFIRFVPDPIGTQSLSALPWTGSADGITYGTATFTLPGSLDGFVSARTTFTLDASASYQGDTAMLVFEKNLSCANAFTEAIVNGHWVSIYYNGTSSTVALNVTPYLRWGSGAANTVEILLNAHGSVPQACPQSLSSAGLTFYAPGGIYP